ncbi:DoxX family protein [Aestuariispira ectoiniformans]|uniref:DoxX family protein n=1 Tax=Aestuariispira ectoiniformans TaxID=2775080 RepID=UPI00223B7907|nr:DoxX family protein [Aestuariispira ectoiniformans]
MTTDTTTQQTGQTVKSGIMTRYRHLVRTVEATGDDWLIGFAARLGFAALLLPYYFNSALTKFDSGFLGLFPPSAGAFAQILPSIAEQYSYDVAAIPFFPWHLVVIAGSLTEILLPLLIVAGLFSRLSALGMIGFVIVQTIVDVVFHGVGPGVLFNGLPTELIDQRLLWVFLLLIIATKGAGRLSLDHILARQINL